MNGSRSALDVSADEKKKDKLTDVLAAQKASRTLEVKNGTFSKSGVKLPTTDISSKTSP